MRNLISQISLSKEEERKINIPKYQALFTPDSYYQNLLEQEKERLILERKKYNNNYDFYKAIALEFAKLYIPQIISDYGSMLDENTLAKLLNIINGDGLKIFRPGEAFAKGYIPVNENGKPTGDDGAFAISELGSICFTPEKESSKLDLRTISPQVGEEIAVNNALKMLGAMVHETFHLLIDVRNDEVFSWIKDGKQYKKFTSGGFILDEGLVEKFTTDFCLRHKFVHNPALDYFHYVDLCNVLESIVFSKEAFFELVINYNYVELLQEVLTPEEFTLYQYHERKKFLERYGVTNLENVTIQVPNMEQLTKSSTSRH